MSAGLLLYVTLGIAAIVATEVITRRVQRLDVASFAAAAEVARIRRLPWRQRAEVMS